MVPVDDDSDPAVADTGPAGDLGDRATEQRSTYRPREIRPGDSLGRYQVGDELGEGGMAIVYQARDTELRREVAIKVLFPHLARRDEVVRRFHREARAAAGLEHSNILRIYDVGGATGDDPPYIVMELIRGRTLLAEVEQRGAMFSEVAACVGALLADALAAAHRASVVHRDVKPANVMIASNGRILLGDFGVARLETEESLITKTGALLGTPAYMSPEQASGDTATARSDLYSLGATLYQLTTGVLPYAGSPAKVIAQIASGAFVAPNKRRPGVGPDLSRLIERLMTKEPQHRPETASDVASELRAIAAAGGLGEPTDELTRYFADPEQFLRTCTPAVVKSLIAGTQTAMADGKLPRAMALAERASMLAPDDPEPARLIATITEGGRATQRRKRLVMIAGIVAVLGGGTAVALTSGVIEPAPGSRDAATIVADAADAADAAQAVDASVVVIAIPVGPPLDAIADTSAAPAHDAAVAIRTNRPPPIDAAIDAAPPADAAVVLAADAALPPEPGAIIIANDTWCDVEIDGVAKGRKSARPIAVAPGRHTVRCEQKGIQGWTQVVEVAPGETKTVTGSLLETVEVTIATSGDAIIDGVRYQRGQVAKLKRGSHEVISGGTRKYSVFSRSCALRDRPELDCY
ncbi:MAG: serine/threonine-protein kinase [Kofleriaceae bacterium]